jgi:hypothetical protein
LPGQNFRDVKNGNRRTVYGNGSLLAIGIMGLAVGDGNVALRINVEVIQSTILSSDLKELTGLNQINGSAYTKNQKN